MKRKECGKGDGEGGRESRDDIGAIKTADKKFVERIECEGKRA